jgi:hypothetical protein
MRHLILLTILFSVFYLSAQSVFHDAKHVGEKLNNNQCFTEDEFIKLQDNYGLYYADLFDLKFRFCHEDEIRAAVDLIITELETENKRFNENDIRSINIPSIEDYIEPIARIIDRYSYLTEQDIELIIGHARYEYFTEQGNEFGVNMAEWWSAQKDENGDFRGGFSMNFRGDGGNYRGGTGGSFFPQQLTTLTRTQSAPMSVSSIFSGSPAFLVDATAQFLVSRTRQELNTRFIEEMREIYRNKFEFREMFESTNNIILNTDPLNFSTWNTQLQIAMKRDIAELPYTLPAYIRRDDKIYNRLKPDQKEVLETAFIFLQATQNNRNGIHPIASISSLERTFGVSGEQHGKVNASISMLNTIMQSVVDGDQLVDGKSLLSLGENPTQLFLFRLFYTRKFESTLQAIPAQGGMSMLDLLNDDTHLSYAQTILSIAASTSTVIESLNKSIEHIQKTNDSNASRGALMALNNALPILFENAFRARYIATPEKLYDSDNWFKRYRPVVNEVVDMNNNILGQNYQSALLSASNILVLSLTDILNHMDDNDTEGVQLARERIQKMVFWSGFMSDFLSIDGAQSVGELLQKYAEPNASYRTKRMSNYSITLNSYPGAYLGNEQFEFVDNFKQYNTAAAVSAPMGLSFMSALHKTGSKEQFDYVRNNQFVAFTGLVHGIFIPVLDMGAPFAYRWSEDESAGFSDELKWSHLFAPGAYYALGMPRSGLTFAIGGQMTPKLRTITENQLVLEQNAFRFGLIFTYDIPVFTVWRSKER